MVRALLFDLDDTLLDDRGAMADAVLLLRRRHRLAPDAADDVLAEQWDSVGRDLWRRMERGELDLTGQRRERMRRVFDAGLSDSDPPSPFTWSCCKRPGPSRPSRRM